MPDATVLIRGDRIVAVGTSASTKVPAGATRIDGKGRWVIPGMIDGHVHFFQSGNLYTRPDVADFNAVVPYAQEVARNKARLPATFKVWLASGVTSVIDVGGPFWNFEVRDAANKSDAAPRVATTGPLISMVSREKLDLGDPPIVKIESADAARALVARELPYKPDFIKVWFVREPNDDLAKKEAIVKATGDAAHAAHIRLAVHATELDTAKARAARRRRLPGAFGVRRCDRRRVHRASAQKSCAAVSDAVRHQRLSLGVVGPVAGHTGGAAPG